MVIYAGFLIPLRLGVFAAGESNEIPSPWSPGENHTRSGGWKNIGIQEGRNMCQTCRNYLENEMERTHNQQNFIA